MWVDIESFRTHHVMCFLAGRHEMRSSTSSYRYTGNSIGLLYFIDN